jgi:anti-sigma factor RsiW
MDCTETSTLMLDARRGRLPDDAVEAVREHLAGCDACRHADAADAALTGALGRLPHAPAPEALRRRLERQWGGAPTRRAWRRRAAQLGGAAALAAVVAAGTALVIRSGDRSDAMFGEAVNDHLRVLYSEHPIEVESGGIHQIKPWFSGRLDFAPIVPFGGDDEFPLKGGSVAYFLDRKAAALVFGRRLHTITLFVFRADGLPWPVAGGEPLGGQRAFARTTRGFHALLWRDGDLGYALVSDVTGADLRLLAERIEAGR